ncbi:hypothetical protein B484DRAFT_444972 [Ochromonadaceae sp. CCMP2298]|nr:hypothetical protein B484DRAFT_444972 [Ochromonadaceae sp. CCMP2298]
MSAPDDTQLEEDSAVDDAGPTTAPEVRRLHRWYEVSAKPRFVSLCGSDSFTFTEACAYNAKFDATGIYVPVQQETKTYLYRVDTTTWVSSLLFQVKLKDQHDDITVFGCSLDCRGVLWMAVFNCNLVMGVDVKSQEVKCEQLGVLSPNGVSLNRDETQLVICGGLKIKSRLNDYVNLPAGMGTISSLSTTAPYKMTVIQDRARGTGAGVAERDGVLYVASLTRLTSYQKSPLDGTYNDTQGYRKKTIWRGKSKSTEDDDLTWYLNDNLCWFDHENGLLLVPSYRTLDVTQATLMDTETGALILGFGGWAGASILTNCMGCCRAAAVGNEDDAEKRDFGLNAEVDLSFSYMDTFDNVHFSIVDVKSGLIVNYFFKNADPELFDGHCTHAERVGENIVFVNFKKNQLMLLPISALQPALEQK